MEEKRKKKQKNPASCHFSDERNGRKAQEKAEKPGFLSFFRRTKWTKKRKKKAKTKQKKKQQKTT
jgi:hypothetical protein